jgi:hypothetical protein
MQKAANPRDGGPNGPIPEWSPRIIPVIAGMNRS